MFNEVTIKPSKNIKFDLGQIAESLFFYGKVNLVCGPDFFKKLIEHKEEESFLELMISGKICVKLEDNHFGCMQNESKDQIHSWLKPILVRGQNVSIEDRLLRVIKDVSDRPGYSKRLTKKILNYSEVHLHSDKAIEYIDQDLNDQTYLKRVISHTVKNFNPNLLINPEEIEVAIIRINDGYVFKTNINFEKINKTTLNENKLSVDAFLFSVMNTRVDTIIASQMESDLVTSSLTTSLLKEKVNDIIHKSSNNLSQIDNFSEVFLREGKRIKDTISSGERSLNEYLKILDKADKFKDWLSQIDDDKNLLSEYNKAVTKETWVEKLPGKSFRWTFFTGVGMAADLIGAGGIGTASGIMISAGDSFLLDKIIKGWKPNSFVNDELDKFFYKD